MNDLAMKILSAEAGRTHIFAVGQAGYIIKTSEGKLIAIDLYLSDCVERLEGHMGYKRLVPKVLVKQLQLEYFGDNITYIKPGDIVDEEGFALQFVNCDHGTGAPDAVGVVIHADGKRIYEAGDTCLRLDRVGEIKLPLDVLIAPINGAYGNMNADDCVKLAEALRPGLTIPCHYGMFASHGGDPGRFIELMKETGLKTLLMTPGEKYTL